MKNKTSIVLQALLRGIPVELEGYIYKLFSPGDVITTPSGEFYSEEYFLGVEMIKNRIEKVYLGCEMELTTFIKLTEKIENDMLAIIAAENVLNNLR